MFTAAPNIFKTSRSKYLAFIFLGVATFYSPKPMVLIALELFLVLVFAINSKGEFFEKRFLTNNFVLIVLVLMSVDISCNYSILPNRPLRFYDYFVDFTYPTTRTLYPLLSISRKDLVSWRRARKHGPNPDALYQSLLKSRDDIKSKSVFSKLIVKAGIQPVIGSFLWRISRYPLPFDVSPIIHKKASLTHPYKISIFFRAIPLNDMLHVLARSKNYERALGVNTPIIYFSSNAKVFPEKTSKRQVIGAVYNDVMSNLSSPKRSVFFLEKDIDFNSVNKEKNGVLGKFEYTDRKTPNRLEFLVDASTDGFLVRLENYNSGWSAFVDGVETRIYKANYAFQAIKVPKGKHKVSFQFKTIYPFLFYSHIIVVLVCWFLFNLYLNFSRKLNEEPVEDFPVIA